VAIRKEGEALITLQSVDGLTTVAPTELQASEPEIRFSAPESFPARVFVLVLMALLVVFASISGRPVEDDSGESAHAA
jgi:hypothetical protein